MLAEALSTGVSRPRYGNEVYGAFGRDFVTADHKRIMIMAITPRQWSGLIKALGIEPAVGVIESERGVSFARDEGVRFTHRDVLMPLVESAVARQSLEVLSSLFDRLGVCWAPYRTMLEAASDPVAVTSNPLFNRIEQKSGLSYPVCGAPVTIPQAQRQAVQRAPQLGEHTDYVLARVLGMETDEIGRLHDSGIVAS
jgi:2-methylfumaryl-CoA isomerase